MKLICYLSGGYPTMEKSLEAAAIYAEAGCDAIEWSFPTENPYLEAAHIRDMMEQAAAGCQDYDVYMESLQRFREKYQKTDIMLMLYEEVVKKIGVRKLAGFCQKNGIRTIITADISDPEIITILEAAGVFIAPYVSFQMEPDKVEAALRSKSFIYVQAMPNAAARNSDFDWDTLRKCIAALRQKGCLQPIYCGGGIHSPEDIAIIKAAGGDGFFLGSSIIQDYGEPEKMKEKIRAYQRAGL